MKPAEKEKVKALLAHTADTTAALTRKRMAQELAQSQAQPAQGAPAGGPPPQQPPQGMPPPQQMMKKGGKIEAKWPFEGKKSKLNGPKAKKSTDGIAQKGKTKGKVR